MNILFGKSISDEVRDRYILLPLDTFYFKDTGNTDVAYCLIENIPILEMMTVEHDVALHNELIEHYKKKDWMFCDHAISKLLGKWNGEVDSFYESLSDRIKEMQAAENNGDSTVEVI